MDVFEHKRCFSKLEEIKEKVNKNYTPPPHPWFKPVGAH